MGSSRYSPSSPPPFTEAYYAGRAMELLRIADPRNFCFGMADFNGHTSDTGPVFITGTGAISAGATLHSCIVLSTGATAASQAAGTIGGMLSSSNYHRFPVGATSKIYGVCRFKINTGFDPQAAQYAWSNNFETLQMGADGTLHATNYIFRTDTGGTLNTGVAVDANFHVMEFAIDGATNVQVFVDETTRVTASGHYPSVNSFGLTMISRNRTTAVDRQLVVDFIGVGFVRPT